MKKRFSLVLFVLLMVGYILPCFAVSADSSLGFTVVDGVAQLGTETELRAFAAAWMDEDTTNNYSAKLTADIALTSNWTPFVFNGTTDNRVTFNGNGHTVSGMNISKAILYHTLYYSGFIAYSEYADITDLTVTGSIILTDSSALYSGNINIGGIFGNCYNVSVKNCTTDVDITYSESANTAYIGGISGHFAYNCTVANCISYGDINVKYNRSSVSVFDTDDIYIGGITGRIYTNDSFVINCASHGEINFSGEETCFANIGGIVGESINTRIFNSYSCCAITETYNDTVNNFHPNIGGIVGTNSGSSKYENCVFTGTIVSDSPYKGGFIGYSSLSPNSNNVYSTDITDAIVYYYDGAPITADTVTALNNNRESIAINNADLGVFSLEWELKDGNTVLIFPFKILNKPTTANPTIEVNYPEKVVSYQWQKFAGYYDINYESAPVDGWTEVTNADGKAAYKSFAENGKTYVLIVRINDVTAPVNVNIAHTNYASGGELRYHLRMVYTDGTDSFETVTLRPNGSENDIATEKDVLRYIKVRKDCDYEMVLQNTSTESGHSTSSIYIPDIEKWVNIDDNDTTLNSTDSALDGATVRCVVKYNDGTLVISDPFVYRIPKTDDDDDQGGDNTNPDGDNTNPDGGNTNPDGDNTNPDGGSSGSEGSTPGGSSEGTATREPSKDHAPIFMGTTVRVYDADNGTITPNGIPMIIAGMTKTFKFIPDEGYVVADVIVNGESIGAVESYTIDGWQGYVKLTAVFEAADDGE